MREIAVSVFLSAVVFAFAFAASNRYLIVRVNDAMAWRLDQWTGKEISCVLAPKNAFLRCSEGMLPSDTVPVEK